MKRRADEKGHLLRRTLIALAVVLAVGVCLFALKEYRQANAAVAAQAADGGIVMLPLEIDSGRWNYGHCQGIAVDGKREYIYYSFTTALIKTDLEGNVVGTVTGLLGHLGCIAFVQELEKQGEIPTDFGETLSWRYYTYAKSHPLTDWCVPTSILWADGDALTDRGTAESFAAEHKGSPCHQK